MPNITCFSWFKNVRVELDGTEVTQSSKVSDMQIVQHIMSLMESSIGKLQYSDSDLFGLQKLDPRKSLKRIPLANYEYVPNEEKDMHSRPLKIMILLMMPLISRLTIL